MKCPDDVPFGPAFAHWMVDPKRRIAVSTTSEAGEIGI